MKDKRSHLVWEKQFHAVDLLLAMTEREVKARYRFAILGFLWIILNPLLQMIVIGSVFSFVFKVPIPNYFLFLFTGLLVWNFFSYTLSKVTPSIIFELSLIEKAKFPREVIVLSMVLSNLFHTVISFVLLAPILIVTGQFHLERFVLLPFPLLWLTFFLSGVGLLTAALNVRFRDVNFFVQALIPLWFYGTPIAYSTNLVPPKLQVLLYFNPLAGILEIFHWIITGGNFPSTQLLGVNLIISIIVVVVGIIVFRKEAPFFDDWV
jgi:lipopolysaccharide transport system permease protein